MPSFLPLAGRRTYVLVPFLNELAQSKSPKGLAMIWTRETDFISYDDNSYSKRIYFFSVIQNSKNKDKYLLKIQLK